LILSCFYTCLFKYGDYYADNWGINSIIKIELAALPVYYFGMVLIHHVLNTINMETITKKSTAKKPAIKGAPVSKSKTDNSQKEPALKEFLIDEIKDIYWAEKHLTKVLPKMQKAATSKELKDAIGDHLKVTETHVTRLEKVFSLLGEKAQAKKCDAMEGITKEGAGILEDTD
jgi:hypothetical protein